MEIIIFENEEFCVRYSPAADSGIHGTEFSEFNENYKFF
jgi:hypothetical protein